MPNEKKSGSLRAIILGAGLMIALVLAMFATSAQAAPGKGDSGAKITGDMTMTPVMTTTPEPHRTPLLIRLRPWVQFGHARPGGTAHYRQVLFNHLRDPTIVNLGGGSLRGWNVRVDPTQTTTLPAYANIITTTVGVPNDPDHWIDIERTHASISSTVPFTTSAYMITITRRHPWVDLQEGNWADDPCAVPR